MFPPDVSLDVGTDVHRAVASRPGALIDDADVLSLEAKTEKTTLIDRQLTDSKTRPKVGPEIKKSIEAYRSCQKWEK